MCWFNSYNLCPSFDKGVPSQSVIYLFSLYTIAWLTLRPMTIVICMRALYRHRHLLPSGGLNGWRIMPPSLLCGVANSYWFLDEMTTASIFKKWQYQFPFQFLEWKYSNFQYNLVQICSLESSWQYLCNSPAWRNSAVQGSSHYLKNLDLVYWHIWVSCLTETTNSGLATPYGYKVFW